MVGAIHALVDNGDVPMPSIVSRSSDQGLWLFWLLRDVKNPDLPVPAYPSLRRQWKRVQNALHELFASLGADPNARKANHTTRISGSLRTDKGSIVVHSRQVMNGVMPVYTLPEIADYFGISPNPAKPLRTPAKRNPNRKRGPEAHRRYLLEDFEKLIEIRNHDFGKVSGYSPLVWLYAAILKENGFEWSEVCRRATEFGIKIGFNSQKLANSIEEARDFKLFDPYNGGTLRHQTIADWLDITPEESRQLKRLPAAAMFCYSRPNQARSELRSSAIAKRHAEIKRIISEKGTILPVRDMADSLVKIGIKTSKSQLARDYRQLGILS